MISTKSKHNFILPTASIPVIYFLMCRLLCFLYDAWAVELPAVSVYIGTIAGVLGVTAFRKSISVYLSSCKNNGIVTFVIYLLSALFTFSCKGILTADCIGGGNIVNLIGAWLLLGCIANIVFSNISYVVSAAKKIRLNRSDIMFLAVIFLLLNLQAIVYCKYMKQIFIWDNAGYFTTVHMLDGIFPSAEYFKEVYRSVFTTDYNYIIAIPANIMCALFGKSRLVFVLSIVNFYLFPLFKLIYITAKKVFAINMAKTLCIFLLLPYMIFATNTGFVDIGCVLPALAVTVFYLYGNRNKCSWLCGITLALCILMRRWYSFWSLSFVITAIIHGVITRKPRASIELALGCGFGLLFFAQSFVSGKLLADYGNMYSAYALGLKYDILLFTRYFGILVPVSAVIYTLCKTAHAVQTKKKCPETFLLVQLFVCFGLFVSIQTHGQQHLALYLPMLLPILLSMASIVRRKHISLPLAIICALHTGNTFVPRVQPTAISEIKHPAFMPNYSAYPPVNPDVHLILDITEYMDGQIGTSGKTVCLLASSLELNYDTLKNAEISLSAKQKYNIDRHSYYLPISDIDNRDGLGHNLFEADYILVPSSLQIHLSEDEQEVISVPYRHIIENTGFGTAYAKEAVSFPVSDGLTLNLYRRTRDVTHDEIQEIYNEIFQN